jgi:hypothetical protein
METKAVITREELLGLKVAQDELRKRHEVKQKVETIKRSIIAAALGEKTSYTQDVSGWKFTEDIADALRVMFPDSKVELSMNEKTQMEQVYGRGSVMVTYTNNTLKVDWS